ncbi:hypothetical protein COY32_04530 [candidate division WWE3 bacterium CG_4_10_14_0_2_um_filter_41_14]|uniref:Uncharacterized protein n=1 Tax=candidate division WWE3 bacterium CG_4_10_14_0_2_um_filter_41_14 TaxID=1975072 RepID=A0A2M7THT0_UNCKA|nr:MAG: hypothetical protein COY32_04530 [candidate division WWE3 bacterium CG_4_10_14_0_2_um_filter_41_14]
MDMKIARFLRQFRLYLVGDPSLVGNWAAMYFANQVLGSQSSVEEYCAAYVAGKFSDVVCKNEPADSTKAAVPFWRNDWNFFLKRIDIVALEVWQEIGRRKVPEVTNRSMSLLGKMHRLYNWSDACNNIDRIVRTFDDEPMRVPTFQEYNELVVYFDQLKELGTAFYCTGVSFDMIVVYRILVNDPRGEQRAATFLKAIYDTVGRRRISNIAAEPVEARVDFLIWFAMTASASGMENGLIEKVASAIGLISSTKPYHYIDEVRVEDLLRLSPFCSIANVTYHRRIDDGK